MYTCKMMYSVLVHKGTKMYLGLSHESHHYVVGFKNLKQANMVSKRVGPRPQLKIHRTFYENIASTLNDGLADSGLGYNFTDVTIDTEAVLEVPWDELTPSILPYRAIQVPFQQIISWPFEKRLGIIMADEMLKNSNTSSFNFICQVIDPVEDIEMFRTSLRM